uniref:KRAB A domain containing protein n=1 Tax=Echinococcus granulosus TaxID=6210 RepID=A0A068X0X4_ECHGR|nr:KRAB A domain containing protein [Echinococcus granulosus]
MTSWFLYHPPREETDNILVMVNYFAKVAETEPMKSQNAGMVASVFFNWWICQHGVPESVHGDQGLNFESRLFTELYQFPHPEYTASFTIHGEGHISSGESALTCKPPRSRRTTAYPPSKRSPEQDETLQRGTTGWI